MAKIKDPSEAIIREPESAGVKIEPRNPSGIDAGQAPVSPKTAGAADKDAGSRADRLPGDGATATSESQRRHVPSQIRRIAMPPRPEPDQEPPVDAPTWTPDVREPDPDLLPDELPVPNPDDNRDPPKRTLT